MYPVCGRSNFIMQQILQSLGRRFGKGSLLLSNLQQLDRLSCSFLLKKRNPCNEMWGLMKHYIPSLQLKQLYHQTSSAVFERDSCCHWFYNNQKDSAALCYFPKLSLTEFYWVSYYGQLVHSVNFLFLLDSWESLSLLKIPTFASRQMSSI